MYFSRTTRALATTRSYALIGSLLTAALLMLAWLIWFWGSAIVVPAVGTIVQTTGDGYVQAVFTTTTAAPLQVGQSALIIFQGEEAKAVGPVTAKVVEIANQGTQSTVGLYAELTSGSAPLFAQQLPGTVAVAVERISPAVYFLRASGQLVKNSPVALNQ